jgi:hypothetical protein
MAKKYGSTSAQQLSHTRTTKHRPRPELPRDAREAATRGYDFGALSASWLDEFVGKSNMVRRGAMELENALEDGDPIEIPFTAHFTFGKPKVSKLAKL